MNKRAFKNFITWLLIASLLLCGSGCYTYGEVTKLDEAKTLKRRIEVTTKGNNVYTFREWYVDSSGTIKGHATWNNPAYDMWSHSYEPKFIEGDISVQSDSIKGVTAEKANIGLTILTTIGVTAAVLGFFRLAWSTAPSLRFSFGQR
jgi:hypothetical protein